MSKEKGAYEEVKEELKMATTIDRGFSGAPKFSEFRRTVTTTTTTTSSSSSSSSNSNKANSSSSTKENKDIKPVTKSRGLDEKFDGEYYGAKENEEEIPMFDETKYGHGLMENILEQLSVVKQEVKDFTHDVAHEMNEFYHRSIRDEHDS